MLSQLRRRIARLIAPEIKLQRRMYQNARGSRLIGNLGQSANSSADAELASSLTQLRSRSRALVRDASYAKRAKMLVVNNVIGTGIGMQSQVMTTRDQLNDRVNDGIEAMWADWSLAENCHTGGRLAFKHIERALMGGVFEGGDMFVREHFRPFGPMGVPYALELIEPERIADDIASLATGTRTGNEIRMGVEVDEFYRPVAYYIRKRHPGEIRFRSTSPDEVDRVPADQIIPLSVVDRWPQTRGEPWLHAVIRTFSDLNGYVEAEITRARAQASIPWTIESPEDASSFAEEQDDGSYEMEVEAGIVKRLNPGEKMNAPSPNAPNPALAPFVQYILRDLAAGTGVKYSSLSMDYSQANYSSERVAQFDDRDIWRFYQSWFICDFRYRVHKRCLQQAVLAGKIPEVPIEQYGPNPKKFEAVLFKPRGWSWIDPSKDIEAAKESIRAGLDTRTGVIAQNAGGLDIEDIDRIRERELRLAKEKGLKFDTDPDYYMSDAAKALADAKATAKAAAKPPPDEADDDATEPAAEGRVFSFPRK